MHSLWWGAKEVVGFCQVLSRVWALVRDICDSRDRDQGYLNVLQTLSVPVWIWVWWFGKAYRLPPVITPIHLP